MAGPTKQSMWVDGCERCDQYHNKGGPEHYASPRCRSGKRDHCTCDTCF